jgi:hypothetical protein
MYIPGQTLDRMGLYAYHAVQTMDKRPLEQALGGQLK